MNDDYRCPFGERAPVRFIDGKCSPNCPAHARTLGMDGPFIIGNVETPCFLIVLRDPRNYIEFCHEKN